MELRPHHRRRRSQLGPGRHRGRVALKGFRLALILAAIAAAVFCFYRWQTGKNFVAASAPLRLTQVTFGDLPGWAASDANAGLAAFRRSCAVLAAEPASQSLSGAGYAGTAGDWRGVCDAAQGARDARGFFQAEFLPYQLGAGGATDGLFTGYYEPQISGSRQRHGAFQTPVYGLPPDLVRVDLGLFSPKLKGEHVSGRLQGQRLVPYPDRAAIDAQGIANAKILFWCDDPVALFFLQIQGSGRVRFDDGTVQRIAYAGENGRPYTAIGRVLIRQGALTRETVSLASIRAWLKAHPAQARAVMEADQSFIFFLEAPLGDAALGSPGTLGVPLTPRASLAVDARLQAMGAPFYVAAPPVTGLMIGQDTGGAIRGAVRGDVFFGLGAQAEQAAGSMKADGTLYVLLPRAVAARLGRARDFP